MFDVGQATAPVVRHINEWRHKMVVWSAALSFLIPYRTVPLFQEMQLNIYASTHVLNFLLMLHPL